VLGWEKSYGDGGECLPNGTPEVFLTDAGIPVTVSEFDSLLNESSLWLDLDIQETTSAPKLVKAIYGAILKSVQDSTPGVPLNIYGPKKGCWTSQARLLIKLVISRLKVMLLNYFNNLTSLELLHQGFCDAVYLFVKNEPHNKEKLKSKRLRLIMSISLVTSLIERLLFTKQNKLEISMCDFISFKPGMGLNDSGLQQLYSWFSKREDEMLLCSTDVSAWDWSVPGFLLDMARDYRLATSTTEGAFARLVSSHYYCIQRKVFQSPDGNLYEQIIPGIQASGSYNTSSDNSHMRHMLATLVQLRCGVNSPPCHEGAQMGDDALERRVPGMNDAYGGFGFRVKGITTLPKRNFSFCSTNFNSTWEGQPENWSKTLFRFLFKGPADPMYPTYRAQLDNDLRYCPQYNSGLIQRLDRYAELCGFVDE